MEWKCLRFTLTVISHLHLGLLSGCFSLNFPTKPCLHFTSFIHAICPAHLILLDLFCQIIFSQEYKSQSCSLSNSHKTVTSPKPLLNIFLITPFSNALGQYSSLNPLAYTAAREAAGLARSINTQPAVRRNSETNPTSQHNRGMY